MPWLTDRRLFTAALLAWATVALIGLLFGPTLGHDEASFALTADGRAPPGSWLYRSQGTVWIARIGIALGGAEWQMRLASAVLNSLAIVAAYAVGRVAFSPRTGAWAAAVLAGAHPMALRSVELLSDLPATAGVLGGIAILISELDRKGADPLPAGEAGRAPPPRLASLVDRDGGPRWRIVLAAPVFAATFYVRYGSAPIIAFAIAVACALWIRAVVRRPWPMLALVGVLALLLIPHALRSREFTDTSLGILRISAAMPRRAYIGEGLVTYLTSNPFVYYGALVAPVMVAGLVGVVRIRRKAPWYLAIIAVGQLVTLGLQSHGQPRYVFVATALLVVLGVATLAQSRFARPRIALALVVASWLGVIVAAPIYYHHVHNTRAQIVHAGAVLRDASAGRPCVAVALIVPQLMWYSPCRVFIVGLVEDPLPADHVRYAVSFASWPIDVPRLLARLHLEATPIPTRDPRASIWELR
jgi:4-amino-4-deoxy-L-arabinose transferase-like glycosyltransferase